MYDFCVCVCVLARTLSTVLPMVEKNGHRYFIIHHRVENSVSPLNMIVVTDINVFI